MNDLILDQCLEDLCAKRATVAECLARHPGLADELKPLLETVAAIQAAPAVQPSAAFKQATRARLLRLQPPANIRARQRTNWLPFSGSLRYAAAALVIVLLFIALTGGVTYAASNSLPGSALYPVKRTVEQVELALATTPESQARVHMALADQRLGEAAALAKNGQHQLAEQALQEYSAQVDAAVAAFPPQSGRESSAMTQAIVNSLARQQKELRAIQVPAEVKKTVEDAIGVSKKAIEHFSIQPAIVPTEPSTTKPANTPTVPVVAPPKATETPRKSEPEHGKGTPTATELPLQPTLAVPAPAFTPVPTITLSIPVAPGPKRTLPVPLPDVGNSHKDGK